MDLKQIATEASTHGKSELNRIDYLDGWRGLAILFVLISHFIPISGGHDLGRLGVDIFFVLSGMLMANILFIKKVPLKTFYKRRISRIFPVFILFLTSVSLASWIFELSEEHKNYLFNLFFIRAYYPEQPNLWITGIPIGHLWSLYVEEHCYILMSLLTLAFIRKKASLVLLALALGSILTQVYYYKFTHLPPAAFILRTEVAASFLLLSAGYFLIKSRFESYIPAWAPVLALLISIILYTKATPHWTANWIISPFLLAFTVNHLNLTPLFFKQILSLPILRLIGIWSFSIYLWQQPLFLYGTKYGDAFPYAGPILFILSILIGAASFYLFENPMRRYINNKW